MCDWKYNQLIHETESVIFSTQLEEIFKALVMLSENDILGYSIPGGLLNDSKAKKGLEFSCLLSWARLEIIIM